MIYKDAQNTNNNSGVFKTPPAQELYDILFKHCVAGLTTVVKAVDESLSVVKTSIGNANLASINEYKALQVGQIWSPRDARRANKQVVIESMENETIWYRGLQTKTVHAISARTFNRPTSAGFAFVAESMKALEQQAGF